MIKPYLLAAGVILTACGGNDAATPSGGNPNNTASRSIAATADASPAGYLGNYLATVPQVTVSDAQGHGVSGVQVTFAAQGGGVLTGATIVTDSTGRAQPRTWRLGSGGTQSLTASAPGATPVTINAAAMAPPAGTFRIEVRYAANTTPTEGQKAAFDAAAARWSQLLLQGGAPTTIQEVDLGCGDLRGETVTGLIITADLSPIDGKGKVLGSAGPCLLRDQGYLPLQGYMQFDTADLANLEASNQLQDVILHEMGHVLGFGTIWEFNPGAGFTPNAFLHREPPDPVFLGAAARAALFGSPGGLNFSGGGVPVEETGGSGTAYAHWRESTFASELMSGWLNGGNNPLSAVTVNQFRDLGYVVNDALADGYAFAAMLQSYGVQPVALVEKTLEKPLVLINKKGRAVGSVPRLFR